MLDDTTWFWTIVDANGLANVSSDEIVALREIIARAETAEARVTALEAEKAGLVKALENIQKPTSPERLAGSHLTSKGRGQLAFAMIDHFQSIARQALSRSSTESGDA